MCICVCVCMYVFVYTVRHYFSCFFLSRANCGVCSVLCSFCIWSLWTQDTNPNTASNPAPSVQSEIKVRIVDSIVGIHISSVCFIHNHTLSLPPLTNGTGTCWMWLCIFNVWLLVLGIQRVATHIAFSPQSYKLIFSLFPFPRVQVIF